MDRGSEAYCAQISNNSWHVPCVIVSGAPALVRLLVDTGACYTVLHEASIIDIRPEYTGAKRTFKTVSGQLVNAYQIRVRQMTIGSVDIGRQLLWIAPGYQQFTGVLGVDILKYLMFLQVSSNHTLLFAQRPLPDMDITCKMLFLLCTVAGISYRETIELLPDCWKQLPFGDVVETVLKIAKK